MNGTGRSGSCTQESGGWSPSGAPADSRPSPYRLLAEPPLDRYRVVSVTCGGGQDGSSRHSPAPITKIRTGAAACPGLIPFTCSSRNATTAASRSMSAFGPKSTSPSVRVVFTACPQGPISSRCRSRPAATIAAKLAGVPISSSSYQPETCSTGTSTAPIRCW